MCGGFLAVHGFRQASPPAATTVSADHGSRLFRLFGEHLPLAHRRGRHEEGNRRRCAELGYRDR